MANQISVVMGREISHPKLATELRKVEKSVSTVNKATWETATALHNIASGEIAIDGKKKAGLWRKDFATQTEFAEFLGMSQGQVSKMSRAVETAEECGLSLANWSVTQVVALLPADKLEGGVDGLLSYIADGENRTVESVCEDGGLSTRALAWYVADYRDTSELADELVEDVLGESVTDVENAELSELNPVDVLISQINAVISANADGETLYEDDENALRAILDKYLN